MHDTTTIILRGGLGTLRFGASSDEVRHYLGEPKSIEEIGYREEYVDPGLRGYPHTCWHYRGLGLDVEFKDVRGRGPCLVGLSCWNRADMRLGQLQLIGMAPGDVIARLAKMSVQLRHRADLGNGEEFLCFSHGLILEAFPFVWMVHWSILSGNLKDEEIDWSFRNTVG